MNQSLRISLLNGADIASESAVLAQLRLTVFREWPYLYDGTVEDEHEYLQSYIGCADSLAILVWNGAECVGASTMLPLAQAKLAVQAPFQQHGVKIGSVAYFGESLVLQPWRGQGLGVKFFELREAHARQLGLSTCAFCAVARSVDHPARPANYIPNDAFWTRRGYRKRPELEACYDWVDVGGSERSSKPMQFWLREL